MGCHSIFRKPHLSLQKLVNHTICGTNENISGPLLSVLGLSCRSKGNGITEMMFIKDKEKECIAAMS